MKVSRAKKPFTVKRQTNRYLSLTWDYSNWLHLCAVSRLQNVSLLKENSIKSRRKRTRNGENSEERTPPPPFSRWFDIFTGKLWVSGVVFGMFAFSLQRERACVVRNVANHNLWLYSSTTWISFNAQVTVYIPFCMLRLNTTNCLAFRSISVTCTMYTQNYNVFVCIMLVCCPFNIQLWHVSKSATCVCVYWCDVIPLVAIFLLFVFQHF